MGTTLNKDAYEDLIMGDIIALQKHMPEFSLEKKHIIEVLKWSVSAIYDKNVSPEHKPDEMDFFKEIEMERQMQEAYAAMVEADNKLYAEISRHNNRIFKAIEKILGKNYLDAVTDCLGEAEANGKLELVRNPEIEKQYEDWDEFDHVLVDQYVNGGYVGDDFAGDIYIPLRDGLYLKSYYQM